MFSGMLSRSARRCPFLVKFAPFGLILDSDGFEIGAMQLLRENSKELSQHRKEFPASQNSTPIEAREIAAHTQASCENIASVQWMNPAQDFDSKQVVA